jgi:uroporphyrinogen-III decarboxylase
MQDRSSIDALGSIAIGVMAESGGFCFDREYYYDPQHRWEQDCRIAHWAETKYAPYPLYNTEAHLVQLKHLPRPFRQVGGIQPNLILGAALGAEIVFPGDRDPDITPYPLRGLKSIDEVRDICWQEREPISTFLRQIDEYMEKSGDDVDVFPPFFWDRSGRATVHGPVTTAHKLIGEEFYIIMMEDFDFAMEILMWIADSYNHLIRLFSERAQLPTTGIHIGECSGCMISPELWENAVIPSMNVMVDACGPVRIHSCGNSDHILEQMSRVHDLEILNIGTDTSISRSRELIGPDIEIDVIPDPQLLFSGPPEKVSDWVRESVSQNGGGPMTIEVHIDAQVPFANTVAIFDTLRELGHELYSDSLVQRWGI